VEFADNIRLLRADLTGCPAPDCTLTLSWAAQAAPAADYTVFVQLWQNGQQVAGFDAPPLNGDYPTGLWAAGETIIDPHRLDLSGLPPGRYTVLAGLYNLADGRRLPAAVNGQPLPDFAVPAGEIEVSPQ
jgi:hypothetical protein